MMILQVCCESPTRNSVLEGLRVRLLDDIQEDI